MYDQIYPLFSISIEVIKIDLKEAFGFFSFLFKINIIIASPKLTTITCNIMYNTVKDPKPTKWFLGACKSPLRRMQVSLLCLYGFILITIISRHKLNKTSLYIYNLVALCIKHSYSFEHKVLFTWYLEGTELIDP